MSPVARTYLVTGAAGFLGSHLTFRLLEEGHRVVALARPVEEGGACLSAEERLRALRGYFGSRGSWPPRGLMAVEGDIGEPWLGLGEPAARRLLRGVDEVVHCAAQVDFAPSQRDLLLRANGLAVAHFLPLLRGTGVAFNLVSTAYVGGQARGGGLSAETWMREVPVAGQPDFRNPYEESKLLGERIVLEQMAPAGVPCRIFRPSIVVGEWKSGKTRSFNALYVLLQLLDGLSRKASGPVRLRVRCHPEAAINLVPIDYVTQALVQISSRKRTLGGLFHLTNPEPMHHTKLGEALSRLFAPLRVEPATEEDLENEPLDRREELLARGLRMYHPYLLSHPRFADAATRRALAPWRLTCPPVDEAWLGRLLRYAQRADWGRRLPPAAELVGEGQGKEAEAPALGACQGFFDGFLASRLGRELLPGVHRLDVCFEVHLTDLDLRRTVEIQEGALVRVGASGSHPDCGRPECRYELASDVFLRIAGGELDPREAFFSRRTDIRGDVEAGLKVASLMIDFFRQHPYVASASEVRAAAQEGFAGRNTRLEPA